MAFTLSVKKRTPGNAQELRTEGMVPCVVYGPQREASSVVANYVEMKKLYDDAGEASLIDLSVEGEKEVGKVLIQDMQFDPLNGKIVHVDFRQIDMSKEMEAEIELNFIGEPMAVKALGGTLVKPHDTINITCLPKDLVSSVDVDLSVLNTFDDAIHIRDLKLPAGITATDKDDMVIAKVLAPLTDEQIKAMEEEGQKGVESVEVVEKKKDEEGEEGTTDVADKTAGDKKPSEKK
jgi:large subunit ribosomal protein L25